MWLIERTRRRKRGRVGLTGRTASPGLFEMMALLGREETIARLNALLTFLAARK